MNNVKLFIKHLREASYWELAWYCLCGYAFSFALSIAMTQICLVAFILAIPFAVKSDSASTSVLNSIKGQFRESPHLWAFYSPLILWVIVGMFSSLLGLDPLHSLVSIVKFSLYFTLPLFVYMLLLREDDLGVGKVKKLVSIFIISHGIAGLHTMVSSAIGFEIKPRVPGPLTESGQLELLFPLLVILPSLFGKMRFIRSYVASFLSIVCLILSVAWVFPPSIGLPLFLSTVLLLGFTRIKWHFSKIEVLFLLCVSLSVSALILGLKRGPWFSIMVEIVILIVSLFGLRSLGGLIFILPLFWVSEVRDRMFSLSEHFFIGGGRFDMWKLGLELIERFPLGLGFGNSDLIRTFDATLPIMHRHMHNNFLNIFLECGLLGGLALFFWFVRLLGMSWPIGTYLKRGKGNFWIILRGAIVVSMLGWQLGGLVEYNFGDGEIRLFALVLLGIYLTAIKNSEHYKKSPR